MRGEEKVRQSVNAARLDRPIIAVSEATSLSISLPLAGSSDLGGVRCNEGSFRCC